MEKKYVITKYQLEKLYNDGWNRSLSFGDLMTDLDLQTIPHSNEDSGEKRTFDEILIKNGITHLTGNQHDSLMSDLSQYYSYLFSKKDSGEEQAVEFTEWIFENEWVYHDSDEKETIWARDIPSSDWAVETKTTSELYQLFKQKGEGLYK